MSFSTVHNPIGLHATDGVSRDSFLECIAAAGFAFDVEFDEELALINLEEEERCKEEQQQQELINRSVQNGSLVRFLNLVRDEVRGGTSVFAVKFYTFFSLLEAYMVALGLPVNDPAVQEDVLKFRLRESKDRRTCVLFRPRGFGPTIERLFDNIVEDVSAGRVASHDEIISTLSGDNPLPPVGKIRSSLESDCKVFFSMLVAIQEIYHSSNDELKLFYCNKKDFAALFVPPMFHKLRSLRLIVLLIAICENATIEFRSGTVDKALLCHDAIQVERNLYIVARVLSIDIDEFAFRAEEKLLRAFRSSNTSLRSHAKKGDPWTLGALSEVPYLRRQLIYCDVCKYYCDAVMKSKKRMEENAQLRKQWRSFVLGKRTMFKKYLEFEKCVGSDSMQRDVLMNRYHATMVFFEQKCTELDREIERTFNN